MEFSLRQQIFELIKKSKNILLATRYYPNEDSIGSLLALSMVLEKMGKKTDMVSAGPLSSTLSFLPRFSQIANNIKTSKNFVISLDTKDIKVAQFSYDFDNDGNRLNIYITPEIGSYDSKHVSTKTLGFKYDLAIILDCPDLETLGSIYDQNTELFYETPIVNIDHRSSNEQYGEVNFIDTKATSTAEVLYSFLESFDKSLIDSNIATCILTGITASTKSFQISNITPRTFTIAAQLVSLGADQQKVIQQIFKNKTLSSLKLWGRALARIKYDSENKIVWTLITHQDFEKTEASFDDLLGIEEELALSVSEAKIILILYEKGDRQISGIIRASKNTLINLAEHLKASPQNDDSIYIDLKDKTLLDAEQYILTKLKNFKV